jgi:hypothetical protein
MLGCCDGSRALFVPQAQRARGAFPIRPQRHNWGPVVGVVYDQSPIIIIGGNHVTEKCPKDHPDPAGSILEIQSVSRQLGNHPAAVVSDFKPLCPDRAGNGWRRLYWRLEIGEYAAEESSSAAEQY